MNRAILAALLLTSCHTNDLHLEICCKQSCENFNPTDLCYEHCLATRHFSGQKEGVPLKGGCMGMDRYLCEEACDLAPGPDGRACVERCKQPR